MEEKKIGMKIEIMFVKSVYYQCVKIKKMDALFWHMIFIVSFKTWM